MFDLDQLFQKSELIPVIIQHARTKDVLMLGFTNREAVERTLPDKDCLVLEPEPGQTMEQGGDLRPLPPCGADLYRLRYRHPALLLPARRPYLSHRTRQLLFSGDYVMIPIVPLGS